MRPIPRSIKCYQHGDVCDVIAQRILTHEDDTRHLYVVAICGERTSLRPHEFAEHCYQIEEGAR